MNLSDHSNISSLFESFFKNVTDSVMDAFKHVVSAQSVYTLSGTSDYKVHPESGHIVFTASAYLVAFNFNASAPFDTWTSLAVSIFHSKTSSPAMRNLVSPQTLQLRFDGPSRTIPPMHQIPLSSFEFSAVPLLLMRLLPPIYAQHFRSTRFALNGFLQPSVLNFAHNPALQGLLPCRVDSFGPFESGTLYAGDGVTIQPANLAVAKACLATLRFPRTSFPSENMTFLWSRVRNQSETPSNPYSEGDIFQPDATQTLWYSHSGPEIVLETGRISIKVFPNGTIINKYWHHQVSVNGDEVLLNIRLNSTDPVTLHAVRRFKIEPHDTDVTTRLTPMQPMFMRSESVDHYNKWHSIGLHVKPIDFSCTELDLTYNNMSPNGTRAVLTAVALGGFDSASAVMSYHVARDEYNDPPSSSLSVCSLERQFVATVAQEKPLPSVGSPAGSATVTFKQLSQTSVSITVVATGLTSNLTGVHIHLLSNVATAATGPVVFPLCSGSPPSACPIGLSPTVSATWTAASGLTSAILDSLFSSSNIGLYVNIHTVSNPFGELRADVDPPRAIVQPNQPGVHPRCSYVQALYRQHAVSSSFGDFPTAVGRAQLANAAGYYVSCVSASEKYSGSVHQDGAVMLRFQKKDIRDRGTCASGQ